MIQFSSAITIGIKMARVYGGLSVLILFISAIALGNGEPSSYNIYETPETIIANGYPAERHKVVTEDGYILEIHRIPTGKGQIGGTGQKPVVFLMHGLIGASNAFIALGPEKGVAYNYADAGFDVWMGNARGTKNSRNHTSLDPDDRKERLDFFDFSFEEIGLYDIAAIVDYILEITKEDKLHYIGHSQGGTVFLVLNALRPEYNVKFSSAHLMAGVGYQEHCPNLKVVRLAKFVDFIYGMSVALGIVELFPPPPKEDDTAYIEVGHPYELCTGDSKFKHFCERFGMQEIMMNNQRVTSNTTVVGGAALKQVAHYGQNIRDKSFRRWNYGVFENLRKYGQINPPSYDLSLITVNVTMHYTVADTILDERDVLAMVEDLPNSRARKVAREDFLHGDFIAGDDAKELVTDYVIDAIWSLERTTT